MSWESEASNWIAWARAPGHDAYWYYRDSFFDEILVPPRRATLDLGCGEGRLARDRGHLVTGVDSSPTLVEAARKADPSGTYVVADAASMPFDDGSFDLAVAETARVLEPGSCFCISLTHPFFDAGAFESRASDAPFVVEGSYLGRRRFEGTEEHDGLSMTFRGWSYPLGDYARALEDARFVIERIREPVAGDQEDPRHARMPLFLQLRALKPA